MVNVHGTREIRQLAENNSDAPSTDHILLLGPHILNGDLTVGVGFQEVFPEFAVLNVKL